MAQSSFSETEFVGAQGATGVTGATGTQGLDGLDGQQGPGGVITVAVIRDEKTSTTAGGTFTSGAWRTRDLNTLSDPKGIITSLSSNQFTLPAGTYHIHASAPAYFVDGHQARLQNITDATTTLYGSSEYQPTGIGNDAMTRSVIMGTFTIGSAKTFEIQHICDTTRSTNGFGRSTGFASNTEVYTEVTISTIGASGPAGAQGATGVAGLDGIDGLPGGSSGTVTGCLLNKTTTQSVTSSTHTALTFENETFDTNGFHDTSTNTSRITIPSGLGGVYSFGATVEFANSSGLHELEITKNGVGQTGAARLAGVLAAAANNQPLNVSGIAVLAAGDYIECDVLQTSGTPQNIGETANNQAWFWAIRLGPSP